VGRGGLRTAVEVGRKNRYLSEPIQYLCEQAIGVQELATVAQRRRAGRDALATVDVGLRGLRENNISVGILSGHELAAAVGAHRDELRVDHLAIVVRTLSNRRRAAVGRDGRLLGVRTSGGIFI